MAGERLHGILAYLQQLTVPGPCGETTDGQLLERFVRQRDETAFAVLVRRHGPLVWGVCRRLLRSTQDAEDAFQATFLILARRAGSIGKRESVRSWLYGVAVRVAVRVRGTALRRRERPLPDVAAPESNDLPADLREVLDEELSRLPERYRVPLILCHLEGRTQEEAARLLGCPRATVATRLARGRDRLRACLARRGLGASAGMVAAAPPVPDAVIDATLRAVAGTGSSRAAGLAEEVIRTMLLARWKTAAVMLLMLGLVGSGAVVLASRSPPPAEAPAPAAEPAPRADAAGDPLPPDAVLRLGTVRLRHPMLVVSLAFAPDGQTLASADYDGRVRLWDAATDRLRLELPAGTGKAVIFAPDGRTLATAGDGNPVRLWNTADGTEVRTLDTSGGGHALAFAPDGRTLLLADGTTAVLREVATGREIRRFTALGQLASALAFSPDGKTVAAGGSTGHHTIGVTEEGDCAIVLWETATGRPRRRIERAHHGWIHALAFAAGGGRLASADPYQVRVWDPETGRRVEQLPDWASGAVAFDAAGKRLAVAGDVALWDAERRTAVRRMGQGLNNATAIALAPDGKTLASNAVSDERVRLWDLDTGRERLPGPGHGDEVRAVAYSPDGRLIATESRGDGTVRLWDAARGREVRALRLPGERSRFVGSGLTALAFSPDGRTLTAAGQRWDVATGRELGPVDGRRGDPPLGFSPDGRVCATADGEGGFRLCDAASGRLLHQLRPHGDERRPPPVGPVCVAFSPDGKTLATGSIPEDARLRATQRGARPEDSVQLWDVATGRRLRTLRPAFDTPAFLAFSPDGDLLAAPGTWQQPLALWDVATGQEVRRLTGQEEHGGRVEFNPVAFSPDGSLIATGGKGNAVVLWETASGQVVRVLRGHARQVCALAFAPDGRSLVSGSGDTTALVWPVVPPGVRPRPWGADTGAALWRSLAGEAATAYPAVGALVAAPDRAVAVLRDRLRPEPATDAAALARLVTDLGAEAFARREEASRRLRRLGPRAEPVLRQARARETDPERRRRIDALLEALGRRLPDPDLLRDLRACTALERIGTADATAVLESVARGADGSPLTVAARAAAGRLRAGRAAP